MIDVFTPKRISPDCLLKSNHRQVKISIFFCNLSLQYFAHCGDHLCGWVAHCADPLCSMLHTAKIDFAVCWTPLRSSLWCAQRSSPWCDSYSRDDLCGMLHTAEMISALCCTPGRHFCDWMSCGNWNRIRKHFSLYTRGPDGFELWKRL